MQPNDPMPPIYFDPRLLPPPPPPPNIPIYYKYSDHDEDQQLLGLQQPTIQITPPSQQQQQYAHEGIDRNEAFHYATSNYMNWTLPYYTENSYTTNNSTDQCHAYCPSAPMIIQHQEHLHQNQHRQQQQNDIQDFTENLNEESDFAISLLIFLIGFFLVVPWFFGFMYVRSKNGTARRISYCSIFFALMSVLVGMIYFIYCVNGLTIEIETNN
eukprot:gene14235-16797_t